MRQGPEERPTAFLERLQEAFRCYIPYGPDTQETEMILIFAFLNQAAPDIKKKLRKLDRLGERNIRDLIMVAERVFNTGESTEEKELKK